MEQEAMIYLAEKRGCTQTQVHRSFHSFNFGTYQLEHRKPFGALHAFNDETLMPGASVTYSLTADHLILLLPVVGGVAFATDAHQSFVEVGEVALQSARQGTLITITNTTYNEPVAFICAWLSTTATAERTPVTLPFDAEATNVMHTLFASSQAKVHLGKFSGRTSYTFKPGHPQASVFAFVVEGAFEFHERLLMHRDGLAIHGVDEVDLEALSNDAIVVVLEV